MPRAAAPPPLSGAHHTEQAALYAHARCHAVHVVFDALSGNATPPSDVDRSCHCQSLAHITGRHRCHICTGTRPYPATSALGLGLALPHLHRDCAQAIRREDQLVHGPHQGNQNPMGARPLALFDALNLRCDVRWLPNAWRYSAVGAASIGAFMRSRSVRSGARRDQRAPIASSRGLVRAVQRVLTDDPLRSQCRRTATDGPDVLLRCACAAAVSSLLGLAARVQRHSCSIRPGSVTDSATRAAVARSPPYHTIGCAAL